MRSLQRYLVQQIQNDLNEKMVFLAGPRQVGKTTLSQQVQPKKNTQYLNWDIDEHRSKILKKEFMHTSGLIIFDEIHKFRRWRNYLKGIVDAIRSGDSPQRQILVTGSAKLDYYRFGGDSLQGRYHYLRLMPLSFKEIQGKTTEDLKALLQYSGFPEPFFSQNQKNVKRWSLEYTRRLFREDLVSLERVEDLGSLEQLVYRLPELIGSPLSINALREDLQLAHQTVAKWITILERLYLVFRISPFGAPSIKAIKKEQKLYFYNWTLAINEGSRLENLLAVHLLKYAFWREDTQGIRTELRFFKFRDHREVDFILLEESQPVLAVECKLSDEEVNPVLRYLKKKYPKIKAYQVHLKGKKQYSTPEGIQVCSLNEFLQDLI